MRIATANAYESAIQNLQRRQAEMSESQMQLTTGKRVNRASDDPVAAARAERAQAAISRNNTDQRAVDASRNAMTIGESALGDAIELMQSARETMVAAGNGSYSDGERRALASKLEEVRKQLLSIANRPDGNGGHVFGGQGGSTAPFLETPNPDPAGSPPFIVTFQGQGGSLQSRSGEPVGLTIDGDRTWLKGRDNATGEITNRNVFDALSTAIARLKAPATTSQALKETVQEGINHLDEVLGNMQSARAEVGEILNRLDGIEGRIGTLKLVAQTEQSNAQDLDMVEAISNFQAQNSGYEAALRTYASVQKLSLFQFIN